MIAFPKTTEFGRRFPKQKFYENLDVSADIKRLFIDQIDKIVWANKLSPQTMNIAAGEAVQEIEVFNIKLADDMLDDRVLTLMDKQIPYHLLFIVERPDGLCKLQMNYKEASQAGNNAFQLRQKYQTEWTKPEKLTLNLNAVNMDMLYESIVRQIAGEALESTQADTLKEAVEQVQEREKLLRQIEQLKSKMKKEKQLSKQMELRREIQRLETVVKGE